MIPIHKILFTHVYRTGGTYLRHLLEKALGEERHHLMFRDYAVQQQDMADNLTRDTRIIYGHQRTSRYSGLCHQEDGWTWSTFIRHPVDRLESHFALIERTRKAWRPVMTPIPDNLADFCLDPRYQGQQRKMIDQPKEAYGFVGQCDDEFYLDSLEALFNLIGLDLDHLEPQVRRTPHPYLISELPDADQERIYESIKPDLAHFYEMQPRAVASLNAYL